MDLQVLGFLGSARPLNTDCRIRRTPLPLVLLSSPSELWLCWRLCPDLPWALLNHFLLSGSHLIHFKAEKKTAWIIYIKYAQTHQKIFITSGKNHCMQDWLISTSLKWKPVFEHLFFLLISFSVFLKRCSCWLQMKSETEGDHKILVDMCIQC